MIPAPKHTFSEKMYEFNQHDMDESWCTYITGITIIANNHWIHFTDENIKTLLDNRPKLPQRSSSNLWFAFSKLVLDVNIMFNVKLNLQKIDLIMAYDWMQKWRMVAVQWKINTLYVNDIKDWKWDKSFPIQANDDQHARCMHIMWNYTYITENFKWILPYNTFRVNRFIQMVTDGVLKREAFTII